MKNTGTKLTVDDNLLLETVTGNIILSLNTGKPPKVTHWLNT